MNMRILILMLTVLAFFSCNNNADEKAQEISTDMVYNPSTADNPIPDSAILPAFEFACKKHDFGLIIQGEKVSYTFKYRNVGGKNLIIRAASGSCGCTVPKFSKKPLAPGESGEIEIIFDSGGRKGMQSKTITVLANTQPSKTVLTIYAEVVVPK